MADSPALSLSPPSPYYSHHDVNPTKKTKNQLKTGNTPKGKCGNSITKPRSMPFGPPSKWQAVSLMSPSACSTRLRLRGRKCYADVSELVTKRLGSKCSSACVLLVSSPPLAWQTSPSGPDGGAPLQSSCQLLSLHGGTVLSMEFPLLRGKAIANPLQN